MIYDGVILCAPLKTDGTVTATRKLRR